MRNKPLPIGLARLALGIVVALVAGLIIWFNGLRYPRREA
jgi:hypothetical protein